MPLRQLVHIEDFNGTDGRVGGLGTGGTPYDCDDVPCVGKKPASHGQCFENGCAPFKSINGRLRHGSEDRDRTAVKLLHKNTHFGIASLLGVDQRHANRMSKLLWALAIRVYRLGQLRELE